MAIDLRQLNLVELSGFVSGILSANYNSSAIAYFNSGNSLGNNVLYITGLNQTISGQKTFATSPNIPYSGGTGQAISLQYLLDSLSTFQLQGIQTFSGGTATNFFYVPSPTTNSGVVNLSYLNASAVLQTGDQNIFGNKTFTGNVFVPIANSGFMAVPFSQFSNSGLDLLNKIQLTGQNLNTRVQALEASSSVSVKGFGGVLSFNGQSGNIFTQGLGGITTSQIGNVFYISGMLPTGSGYIQGPQGNLGPYLNYKGIWNTGNTYSFLDWVNISGVSWASLTGHLSTTGNKPSLSSGNYWALLASGNGPQGPSGSPSILFNWKGNWSPTINYNSGDAIYLSGAAYGLTGGSSSGLANSPYNNSNWSLVVNGTGVDANSFYPMGSNPSGYLTQNNLTNYITNSQTGTFSDINHSHPTYVTGLSVNGSNLSGQVGLIGVSGINLNVLGGGLIQIGSNGSFGGFSSLNWQGEWNESLVYPSGSFVSFNGGIYLYNNSGSINGIATNPVSVNSPWIQFGERSLTNHTGLFDPNKFYYNNDLVGTFDESDESSIVYINTSSYPLIGLNPISGIYNTFEDCSLNIGSNLMQITVESKDSSSPYFGVGSDNNFVINSLSPNEDYSGYGTLTLIRGNNYYFDSEISGYQFILTTDPSGSSYTNQYVHNCLTGATLQVNGIGYTGMIIGQGLDSGTLLFNPDSFTPNTLYYQSAFYPYMGYKINVVDDSPWEIFISGAQGSQGPAGTQGDPGLAFVWRGDWLPGHFYDAFDAVYFSGSSYGATQNNSQVPNDNSPAWQLIAKGGVAGPSGQNGPAGLAFVWRGNWSNSSGYSFNDSVYFNGSSYVSKIPNSGQPPTGFASSWQLVAQSGTKGQKGDQGAGGLGFIFRGDWSSAFNYSSGDSVYYEGSSYGTYSSISGTPPPLSPWQITSQRGGTPFSWCGDWNSGTIYYAGDSVFFSGQSYATTSRSSGYLPSNAGSWFITASQGGVGATGPSGAQGRGINWVGPWTGSGIYNSGDGVSYLGGSYICTSGFSGVTIPPSNDPPWSLIAKGGDPGLTFAWKGQWDNFTNYNPYDSVFYNGSSWGTTTAAIDSVPPGSGSEWFLLASQGGQGIKGNGYSINWRGVYFTGFQYSGGDGVYYQGTGYLATANNPGSGASAPTGFPWIKLNSNLQIEHYRQDFQRIISQSSPFVEEAFIDRPAIFTGFAIGVSNTGFGFTGNIYKKTTNGGITNLASFVMPSGFPSVIISGGFSGNLSSFDRIGYGVSGIKNTYSQFSLMALGYYN